MAYEIPLAVAAGMFIHATILALLEAKGIPVYTEQDKQIIWDSIFNRGSE